MWLITFLEHSYLSPLFCYTPAPMFSSLGGNKANQGFQRAFPSESLLEALIQQYSPKHSNSCLSLLCSHIWIHHIQVRYQNILQDSHLGIHCDSK